jgi:hypothetical protein
MYAQKAAFPGPSGVPLAPFDMMLGGLTGGIQVRLSCCLASELIPS